jgi:hypothetical protein
MALSRRRAITEECFGEGRNRLRAKVCLVPLAGSLKANNIYTLEGGLSRRSFIEAKREFSDPVPPIIQRDDGKWAIGLADDAPGPFESREFALRVASGAAPTPAPVAKFRRIHIREARRDAPAQ